MIGMSAMFLLHSLRLEMYRSFNLCSLFSFTLSTQVLQIFLTILFIVPFCSVLNRTLFTYYLLLLIIRMYIIEQHGQRDTEFMQPISTCLRLRHSCSCCCCCQLKMSFSINATGASIYEEIVCDPIFLNTVKT